MTSNPLVTVIVPTYNRADFLKDSIESILNQSLDSFEIIVCNNCSTDHTEDVVFSFKDNRIKYFRNDTNIGGINNHNYALRKSSGKYIHFFSDDDLMEPNCLELKVKLFEEIKNIQLIHSNIEIIDENNNVLSCNHWAKKFDFIDDVFIHKSPINGMFAMKYLTYNWNFISMPSVMIRKEVIENGILFSHKLTILNDCEFWCQVARIGDFLFIKERTIKYRLHGKNDVNNLNFKNAHKDIMLLKRNQIGSLRYFIFFLVLSLQTTWQIENYNELKSTNIIWKLSKFFVVKIKRDATYMYRSLFSER